MNNNNNNNHKQSKKAGKPKKFGPMTEASHLRKEVKRLERQVRLASTNPQVLERKRQAGQKNAMARGTQIDLAKLNHDSKTTLGISDSVHRMHHHIVSWVKQQAHPSRHMGVHPPYTDNPCQSVQVTPARTVRMDNIVVVAGQCRQLSLLMRGPSNEGASVNDTFSNTYAAMTGLQDAVAFHTRCLSYRNAGGVVNSAAIFPMTTVTPKNIGGVVGTLASFGSPGLLSESGSGIGLGAGQCQTDLSATNGTVRWSPMTATTALPYESSRLGHTRAIMTGLEVTILNTTAQGSRAGDVVSVVPPHDFAVTGITVQQTFARFKTYKVHSIDEKITISIPTRPIDMVYQHPNTNPNALGPAGAPTDTAWVETVFAATLRNAVAHIWINNPSGLDQSYAYEITANWSIAGDLVAGISEEAPLSPGAKPLIVGASVKQSEAPHTTPAQVGSTFVKASRDSVDSSFKGLTQKLINYGVKKLSDKVSDSLD